MSRCRPLTTEEVGSMKAQCTGANAVRDRCILIAFERTGYRAAELASLRVRDVWANHQLRDRIQVQAKHMKKGVSRRAIPLHPELRQALHAWIMCLIERKQLKADTPLWVSRKCKSKMYGLSRESLWRIVKGCADRAGVKGPVGCHSYRKVLALRVWEASGKDILACQTALGHKSVSSTQTYLQGAIDDARIDALFLAS